MLPFIGIQTYHATFTVRQYLCTRPTLWGFVFCFTLRLSPQNLPISEGAPTVLQAYGGTAFKTLRNIYMICSTDATSLIQGCAVYQSINNEIHHHPILGMNHAFIHSPLSTNPRRYLSYGSTASRFSSPLRPSKLPNRGWMEPNFCPLLDLKLLWRPMLSVSAESIGVSVTVSVYDQ